MKKNIEKFVELQVDLIRYESYLEVIRECREKYQDSKLFKACLKKKLGKDFKGNLELIPNVY